MSGGYWIYVDGGDTPLAEIDLMIRPMKGECIWFNHDGLDHCVEITKIVHVCESDYDYARIEVHADLIEIVDPSDDEEDEEDDDSYQRCASCHCTDMETVSGEQGPRTGWSSKKPPVRM